MSPDIKLMALGRRNGTGSGTELIELSVTKNGTYRAPLGKGYSPVYVMTQEADENSQLISRIFSYQTNTPVFSDSTSYTGQIPLGYFRELFGDTLEINCPAAFYIGGSASLMPVSKTNMPVDTPDIVKITAAERPLNFANGLYGASGVMPDSVNPKGVKTFILRCGKSNVIRVASVAANAFRNNSTTTFDCIFDFSTMNSSIPCFFGCALENITLLECTVGSNISFEDCSRLSTESILSIANALKPVSAQRTITLHNNIKQLCENIYVSTTDATFRGEEFRYAAPSAPEDEDSMTLTYYITQIKGWTIA